MFLLSIALCLVLAEVAQLVMAERFLGVSRIRAGADPRDVDGPSRLVVRAWLVCLATIWACPLPLLFDADTRFYGLAMLGVSWLGHEIRRRLGFRFVLVALTFEGALRIGIAVAMLVATVF